MSQPGAGGAGEGKSQPDKATPPADKPQEGGAGQGDAQPMGQKTGREGSSGAQDKNDKTKGEVKKPGEGKDGDKGGVKKSDSSPTGEPSSAGESKPSGDKPDGQKKGRGESTPDAGSRNQNATPRDVEDLSKGLGSNDPKEREQAKRQLEQIRKEARDPMARDKAEQALDQAGQPDGPAEGKKKPQASDGSSSGAAGKRKDEKGEGSKDQGSKKDGKREGSKGDPSQGSGGDKKQGDSGSKGQEGGQGGKDRQSSGSEGSSSANEARNREGGNSPGGGGNRRNGQDGRAGGGEGGADQRGEPSKPRDHRAAQMQLEELLKKVDKNILKDAGVSEQEWKRYLEARRKQLSPPEKPRPDTPAEPRQATKLPSIGGRTIQQSPSGPADTHGPDRGQPPPGYRDPYREFNRQMSK
jgi:hypothetical protein